MIQRASTPTALGERLRILREAAKLPLEVAAERLGVSRSTLFRWETGASKPKSWDVIADLAEVYGVKTSFVIAGLSPEQLRETASE